MARYLAVDPGSVWIGLAVSDPEATIAFPIDPVPARPAATLVSRLVEVARRQGAEELVVGLPRRLDGGSGPEAAAARELAERLRRESGLKVTLVDERLTTRLAERGRRELERPALRSSGPGRRPPARPIRRDGRLDSLAAAEILRTCLARAAARRSRSTG